MVLDLQAAGALRLMAWGLLLALGAWGLAKRPDAAGRAFAFFAVVWAGGIQVVLVLQAAATDAATQQFLYRLAYYAILASTSAILAVVLYAPERLARANVLLAAVLALPVVLALSFASDHQAFLVERFDGGAYDQQNTAAMQVGFPVLVWSGFLLSMLWLGWRAPALPGPSRGSAGWLIAGLGLFAADRSARTATAWVRDPASLGPGLEGQVYGLFMLAFGAAALWMVLRARGLPGPVRLAALGGAAVGATSIATFGQPALGGGLAFGVLLSALLAPAYGYLLWRGVAAAPSESLAYGRQGRTAVMVEA
jgi:hypothetical protein